jgi:2-phospho-L-lactate/phosphoenolpyruvate guanylyltransferase
MGTDTPLTWSVLIPVKVLARAKSRLAGLASGEREALALAMAADTVAAALASPAVGGVVVISDDPAVRAEAGKHGADAIPDAPGQGLNEALRAGAAYAAARWPGQGLAALTADLPALSAVELTAALAVAARFAQAFVPDAAGSGTTLYTAGSAAQFRPLFGLQSRTRHRLAGAVELDLPGAGGLRRDVDTLADLCAAERIGLGAKSSSISEALRRRSA